MTVTVPEVSTLEPAAGASSSLPIATSLVPSDVVVLVYSNNISIGGTFTIDGVGMTLRGGAALRNGSSTRVYVYTRTGLTGSHSLTYAVSGSSSVNRMTVLVVSGLTNSAITADALSDWSSTATTTANTDESTAVLTVGSGQLAIAVGAVQAGTMVFPSNSTPASGWTTDRGDGSGTGLARVLHYIFPSAGSSQVRIQTSTLSNVACALYVLGDAAVVPPLSSTFIGWGSPIF